MKSTIMLKIIIAVCSFSLVLSVRSQTYLIDPVSDGSFEGSHGWTMLNTSNVNTWIVGSATFSAGSKAAYISNNNSANAVTNPQTSNSKIYLYKDVMVPLNANSISISFKYKNAGTSNPPPRCMFAPANSFPVLPTDGRSQLVGAEFLTFLNNQTGWTTYTNTSPLSSDRPLTYQSQPLIPGTTYRILFEWSAADQTNLTRQPPICQLPTAVSIGGNFSPTPNTTETYTANTTGGSNFNYTWAVTGGVISSGQGTSSLNVYFPPGYSSGRIQVTISCPAPVYTSNGTTSGPLAIDEVALSYQAIPQITSFTPLTAAVGSNVTISGQNFGATASDNIVYLGGMKCTIVSATSSSITVEVPKHVSMGAFTVINTTNNLSSTYSYPLVVTNTSLAGMKYYRRASSISSSFNDAVTYTITSIPSGFPKFVLADIDGDGKIDVNTYSGAGVPQVFRNTSTSGSISASSLTMTSVTGVAPTSPVPTINNIFASDINNDGKIDLGASNGTTTNGGYVNINTSTSGTPSFANYSSIMSSNNEYKVNAGFIPTDINVDGKTDIFGVNAGTAQTYYSRNTTSGTTFSVSTGNTANTGSFNQTLSIGGTYSGSDYGDLNNDGKIDVVLGKSSSGAINVLQNATTQGTPYTQSFKFREAQNLTAGTTNVASLRLADFDGDGKLDIVAGNSTTNANIYVFRNLTASGQAINFGAVQTFATGFASLNYSAALAVGDMNGDGKPDIIVANNSTGIGYFENTSTSGAISFEAFEMLYDAGAYAHLEIADIDGDDKPDIVASGSIGTITIIRNKQGEGGKATGDQTVCSGTVPAAFTSTSTPTLPSGTPVYLWQSTTSLTSAWSSASGTNNTADYTPTATVSSTTYYRRRTNSTDAASTYYYSNIIKVTVMAAPAVPTGTGATGYGPSVLTLAATPSGTNTVQWFTLSSGGSAIASGNSYTTASLSATTSYYAGSLTSNGCPSTSRAAVTATIITAVPTAPSTTGASRCDAGAVTLSATSTNAQEIKWYTTSVGGTAVYTGSSFLTPVLSATTTYYVEGVNANGASTTRTSCIATINITPSIVSVTGGGACQGSNVTLSAINSGTGTYKWYADSVTTSTSGTSQTHAVTVSTADVVRYVSSINGTCEGARVKVVATMFPRPSALTASSVDLCGNKPATITLTPPANSSIAWYTAASSGTFLGNGLSYTTAALSSTTTYYALLTDGNGCTAATRSAHTVTYTGPTVGTISNVNAFPLSSNNTFTATGLANYTSYIWQRSTDGVTYTDITANLDPGTTYSGFSGTSGATASLVISTTQLSMHGYKYRLKVVQSAGCEIISNAATYLVADAFGSCTGTTYLTPTAHSTYSPIVTSWSRCTAPGNCQTTYSYSFGTLNDANAQSGLIVSVDGTSKAFITLDLGSEKLIDRVYLQGFNNVYWDPSLNGGSGGYVCSSGYDFDGGQILVSNDQTNWTTIVNSISGTYYDCSANSGAGSGGSASMTFPAVSARYVRALRTGLTSGLSEFKVFPVNTAGAPYIRTLPASRQATPTGGTFNSTVDVTAATGTLTYAWSFSSNNTTYTALTESATVTGVATNSINVTSFASGNAGYYKLVATQGTCQVSAIIQAPLVAPFYSSNAGASALQTLSSWNTGSTGTGGSAPTDFGDGKIFILANASSGTYTFGANWTVNGSLRLNSKTLTVGNFNATIDSVMEGSASGFVKFTGTGTLISSVGSTAKVYPVGTTTYSPVTITNNTGTTDNFSVKVTANVLTAGSSGTAMNNVVNRTWTINKVTSASTNSNYGVNLKFEWNQTDILGTVGDPAVFMYVSGTGWVLQTGASVSRTTNSIILNGFKGDLNSTMFMIGNMIPEISSITPTSGGIGNSVTITGQYFKDASAVKFGGTNATSYSSNSGALNFDGTNDYVTIADNAALDVITNYTIECWVRFNAFSSGASILSKQFATGPIGYYLGLTTTSPYTGINFDGLSSANGLFEANRWYHIAAIKSGSSRTLYVNGVQVSISGSAITANNATTNTTALTLGYNPILGSYLNGTLDEVRLWNTARTRDNVLSNMHGEIATNSTGLAAYYRFNSLTSTSLTDGVSTPKNGTLTNFGLTGTTSNWVEGVYSPTQITAVVGSGTTGNVTVTAPGGTASYSSFTYLNIPVIQYFTPTKTNRGTTVSIYGQYFTGATLVSFGGTNAANYTIVSDNEIQANLAGGASGNVIVTTPGGSDTLGGFIYGIPYQSTPVLAAWNIRNNSTATFPVAADMTNSDYVTSASHSFSGLTAENLAENAWTSANTSTTLDVNTAPFISYTIQTSRPVKFDRVVIPGLKLTSGKMQLRWSVDSYASSLGEFTGGVSPTALLTSVNLAAQSTPSAGSITFRIYFYNGAETDHLSGGTGNTTFDGTVPATYDAVYALAIYGIIKPEPTISALNDYYKNLGEAPFQLGAPQSNSDGTTAFSVANSSVVSLSGNQATLLSTGSSAYTMIQQEGSDYDSAQVYANIYVKGSPELMLANMHKILGSGTFTLAPTTLSSGDITYTSATTATATVSGSTVSLAGAGSTLITASQALAGAYNSATTTGVLTVGTAGLANPTMTWVPVINKQLGNGTFGITSAPYTHTSNSTGTQTYNSGNTSVATLSSSTATIRAAGTSILTLARAATGNYNAASISSALIVSDPSLIDPTLSGFPNITKTLGDADFSISAPTTNSSGAITYFSTNPAVAVISGTTISITGEGRSQIVALQQAAGSYNPGAIACTLDVLSSFTYATPVNLIRNTVVTTFGPVRSGGSQATYTITPDLPTGLSFNTSTGYITGTPTVASIAKTYTVTASINGGASTATANFVMSVSNVAPSGLSYSTPQIYTVGTSISHLVPTVTGEVTSFTISPALPAGLVLDNLTGIISGTPAVALSATAFTVTAANDAGASTTATLTITVNDLAISSLAYATPNVLSKGVAISPLEPSTQGGTPTAFSVSPTLPAGLSIDASTGVISGTPTSPMSTLTSYTVTATNSNNSRNAVVELLVNDAAPVNLSYTTPNSFIINQAITNLTPTYDGGTPTSYSIDPALPAGLTFNTSTGVISGTPTALSSARDYTIIASNFLGFSEKVISIAVIVPPPSITVTGTISSFSSCLGTASTAQAFTVSGTNLTASLVVTAPAGFEVSSTSTGTYGASISLTPTSGTVSSTSVYIRVSASASAGSVSGSVECSSTGGTTQTLSVTANVSSTPNVPGVPTITSINRGDQSATVYFTAPSSDGGSPITGYQHSVDDGSAWTTSGTTSSPISITALTNGTTYPVRIRAVNANGNSCPSTAVSVTPMATITWTGDNSDAWSLASNWSPATVPTASDQVTIPSGRPNQPRISSNQQVSALTIASGATLEILTNKTLTLSSDLTNNGNISGAGILAMTGSAAQSISGTGAISRIEISNASGVTIASGAGNMQSVMESLIMTAGTLFTQSNLTLASNAASTARVHPIAAGASISGTAVVERYVAKTMGGARNGRAWRLLSIPVKGTGTLRDFFMGGASGTDLSILANVSAQTANSGTVIVGHAHATSSQALAAGFDWIGVPNLVSSLRYYQPSTTGGSFGSAQVPSLSTNYTDAAQGYMVFARGDRATVFSGNSNASATTFRSIGTLNQGDVQVSVAPPATANLTLVGNPYMCALDLDAVYTANSSVIKNVFYIWDSRKAGSRNQGGYRTVSYNAGTSQWEITDGGSNGHVLESHTSFFVVPKDANTTAQLITISESHKSIGSPGIQPHGNLTQKSGSLFMNLELPDTTGARQVVDGVILRMDDRNALSLDPSDVPVISNITNPSLWLSHQEGRLSVEGRPWPSDSSFVPLGAGGLLNGSYQLRFMPTGMNVDGLSAWLIDHRTGRSTEVALDRETVIPFAVSDAAPLDSNRFRLVFGMKKSSGSLAPDDAAMAEDKFTVYPNPSVKSLVNISFTSKRFGQYTLKVHDASGRMISRQEINHRTPQAGYVINGSDQWTSGTYLLQLIDAQGGSQIIKALRN